jgi:hypothetical protein
VVDRALDVLGRADDGDPVAQRLVETMPHAQLMVLDVDHLAVFHRTDLTLPVIRPFLESINLRS